MDAYSTLVTHFEEKPILATIWGADIAINNIEGWEVVNNHIEKVAKNYELERIYIKTNFREFVHQEIFNAKFYKKAGDDWWHGFQHGMGILGHIAPIAYCYNLEKVYIASSFTSEDKGKVTCASDPDIDNNLRFSGCKVIHDGYEKNRQMKIKNICEFSKQTNIPIELRVCYESKEGGNCCQCEKCTRTILGIIAEKQNPRFFGFNYSQEEFEKCLDNFYKIAMGKRYPNRIWRESTYGTIHTAFLNNYTKETIPEYLKWFWNYDVSNLRNIMGDSYGQLFVDYGEGGYESNSEKLKVNNNCINKLTFDIPVGAVKLRFDPCNTKCKCVIYDLQIDNISKKELLVPVNNEKSVDNMEIFVNDDPQYIINLSTNKNYKKMEIRYWYKELLEQDVREIQLCGLDSTIGKKRIQQHISKMLCRKLRNIWNTLSS